MICSCPWLQQQEQKKKSVTGDLSPGDVKLAKDHGIKIDKRKEVFEVSSALSTMSFPYSWKYVPNPGDALQEAIRQRQSLQDCLDSCQDWNARACNEYLQKHSCQYRFRDRLSHKRSVIADHQWFCNRRKSANAATTAEPESTQPTASGSQKTNQPSNSERIAEETDSKGKGNNFTKKEGKRGKGKAAEDVVGYSGASGKEKCSNSDGQGMDTAFQLKNLPTAKLSSGKCSKTVEDVTCSLFKSAKPASGAADSFQKKISMKSFSQGLL